MFPQLGVGGGTPMPRNESADSVRIAAATPRVAEISTGDKALGRIWRKMIRRSEAPSARAARTKSRSLQRKHFRPHQSRHPHPAGQPIISMIYQMDWPTSAITARIRKKVGKQSMMSTKRIKIVSIQPP